MARSTLLYVGFSFTDGYFNEIRSELMTLRDPTDGAAPFSYAVISSKAQVARHAGRTRGRGRGGGGA